MKQEDFVSAYFEWLRGQGGSLKLVPVAKRQSNVVKPPALEQLPQAVEGPIAATAVKNCNDVDAMAVLSRKGYPEAG